MKLPPLPKNLPPLHKKQSMIEIRSSLAQEVKETREEQLKKIGKEAEEKEIFQEPEKKVEEEAIPTLSIAQEGVKTAKLIEPEALFQKPLETKLPPFKPLETKLPPFKPSETKLPPFKPVETKTQITKLPPKPIKESHPISEEKLPPISKLPTLKSLSFSDESLSVIASPANLPSKKSKGTPKIKIPRLKGSSVKQSIPSKQSSIFPLSPTIITPIPIKSPVVVSTTVAQTSEKDIMKIIGTIDINKLSDIRAGKGKTHDTYSVAELKTIAGSLNLAKTGSKKDLVERIKKVIEQHRKK